MMVVWKGRKSDLFEACYEKKLFKFQDVIVRSKIVKSLY